jgi:hypothetical protein
MRAIALRCGAISMQVRAPAMWPRTPTTTSTCDASIHFGTSTCRVCTKTIRIEREERAASKTATLKVRLNLNFKKPLNLRIKIKFHSKSKVQARVLLDADACVPPPRHPRSLCLSTEEEQPESRLRDDHLMTKVYASVEISLRPKIAAERQRQREQFNQRDDRES